MNKFQEKQSKFFDKFVENVRVVNLSDTVADKIELHAVLDLISSPKSKKVLEIGCGTGRVGLRLARYCKEVVGLDISPKSITIANRTAMKYKIDNFKGLVGSYDKLNKTDYFDCIIMVSFLHHVDDIDRLFFHVRKLLKKNGTCIILEMNALNPLLPLFMVYLRSVKNHFNKGYIRSNIFSLKMILKKNGFVVRKI